MAMPTATEKQYPAYRAGLRSAGAARKQILGSLIDNLNIERLAEQMDSAFRIPGTKIRFGWDSILGLAPGVGDAATTIVALAPVAAAYRHGAGRWLLARMLSNVMIDATIGAIPLLGDVFDVFFKANRRNATHLARLKKQKAATPAEAAAPKDNPEQ